MTDVFERAYKAFDPAPLSAADSNLYVDLEPARGEGDVVNRLAKRIRGSADEPTCQLLAGHHGSGKSTELRRLQGLLERGTPPIFVVFCEALIGGDLPIHQAAVDRAAREGARAYARQLLEEHVAIVRQVAKTGKLRRTAGNDQLIRELLDSRAVLQYVNKTEWYGVNPLIELSATRQSR